LQAGINWREKGEKSAQYLKRIHQQRNLEQFIGSLGATSISDTLSSSTNPPTDLQIAQDFYQQLYSSEAVNSPEIDRFL
ncbi:hypothetical protein BC941DRAFT_326478, partial [Chlamydoabsidia padenii]